VSKSLGYHWKLESLLYVLKWYADMNFFDLIC